MPEVRYIGDDPELKGCTGWACNGTRWRVRIDESTRPDTPINPTDHPRFFGRHDYLKSDWEEIE